MSDQIIKPKPVMKILLIASLFPPVRHTGALRWTRLCRRMISMGCEFEVVSTSSGFWSPPHEDAELLPDVKVTRVDYPSNFVMAYMKFIMWGVTKFKRNAALTSKPSNKSEHTNSNQKRVSRKSRLGMFLHAVSQIPRPLIDRLVFPHHSKYWARSVFRHCKDSYENDHFDVILATHPYAGTLIAADKLSKAWGIPWVADFRDPWTHDMQSALRDNAKMIKRLWAFEGRTLKFASAVVSINRQMREFLNAPEHKMYVITNSYEPSDYTFKKSTPEFVSDDLNLCYTGNIAEDHEYRLFLEGLKLFQDRHFGSVILHYYGGAFHKLSEYAVQIGLDGKYLVNHGFVKHDEANQRLAEADCGLVFGWRGPLAKLVSTGKVFDSLGVGSPIIGVCAISGSGMEDIIRNSESGLVVATAEEISNTLVQAVEAKKDGKLVDLIAPHYSEQKRGIYTTAKTAENYVELLRKLV